MAVAKSKTEVKQSVEHTHKLELNRELQVRLKLMDQKLADMQSSIRKIDDTQRDMLVSLLELNNSLLRQAKCMS